MPTYKAPIADTQFILNEVIKVSEYAHLPGFEEATPDLIAAILGEGAKFVEEVLQPLNQIGNEVGCTRHADGSVSAPPLSSLFQGSSGLAVQPSHRPDPRCLPPAGLRPR